LKQLKNEKSVFYGMAKEAGLLGGQNQHQHHEKKSRESPKKQLSLQHEQQQQKQRHNSENLIDLSPNEKSEK